MKYTSLFTAALLTTISSAAFAASADTEKFVTTASSSDMFEIKSSKLALATSKNAKVKTLAKQIISDHMKSTAGLKTALAVSGSDAKPASALLPEHAETLEKLKSTDASDFDTTYLDAQETAHKDGISLFEHYASDGDVPALKKFASKTLPTLEMHKDHIEKLDH